MEWYDIFNKGIPVDKQMGFTVECVLENCATDKKKCSRAFASELFELTKRLEKEFDFPFTLQKGLVTIQVDEELDHYPCFSHEVLLYTLLDLLDIDGRKILEDSINYSEKQIVDLIRNRVRELSRIKYSNDLEKKFPTLYEAYLDADRIFKQKQELAKKYGMLSKLGKISEAGYRDEMNRYKEILNFYGFKNNTVNCKEFVENLSKKYNRILKTDIYDSICEYIESYSLEMSKFDNCIDKNKFELLMAAIAVNNLFEYYEGAVANVSYLAQFFRERENSMNDPASINLHINGELKTVTIKDLYQMYKDFLIQHPEVKIIRKTKKDFEGKKYDEILEYLKQYDGELQVSWDILPAGEFLFDRQRSGEGISTDEEKSERQINRERILNEKEEFFDKNKPYLVLKGKNSFAGYIGYIYANAYVVLEKFYKSKTGKSIAEDAIYVMKVEEFIDLSVKSKPEIMENHLCERITHHRGWQGRVEEVLKKAISADTIERVQIFENQINSLKN